MNKTFITCSLKGFDADEDISSRANYLIRVFYKKYKTIAWEFQSCETYILLLTAASFTYYLKEFNHGN